MRCCIAREYLVVQKPTENSLPTMHERLQGLQNGISLSGSQIEYYPNRYKNNIAKGYLTQ